MVPTLKRAFCAVLSCGALLAAAAPCRAADRVALQLKWRHQFQFAGYYMAAEKGYYRDAGLDVEFREGKATTSYTDEVVSGRAQYGVNNTDLLIDRVVRGKKVVVLGVIFQHSPLVLLSLAKESLESPKDFIGKRVMVSADAEAELFSMFANEGIPRGKVRYIPHSWNLEDLVQGRTDAISAYSTNEAIVLGRRGIPYHLTRPITYGIDFYGDCLFTSEQELRIHPKRARAFLAASLKGWEYAFDHVDEACDVILEKYSREKTKPELVAEAGAMEELVVHKYVPLGFMNPGRWKHIGDTYVALGAIPTDYSLDGFLYDPAAPRLPPRLLKAAVALLFAFVVLSLIYIVTLRAFNSRLSAQVAARTAVLQELNVSLSRQVAERKEKERQIAESLAEKEILLKEVHHRVKNNLQIVMSLLNLQLEDVEEPTVVDMLTTVKARIMGMALIHELLYAGGSLSRIDMDEYLRRLVHGIVQNCRREDLAVSVAAGAPGISLPIDKAIPLGLILGELVMNSIKHGFAGRQAGRIEVSLEETASGYVFSASDDGSDRPPAAHKSPGIGLKLIEALCAQIDGTMTVETGHGRRVRIVFG